jgi:ADP-ribosylation factor GTPase-activating protein 2/3
MQRGVHVLVTHSAPDDSPMTAREKFGNQKAISSDMYFGRNAYDPSAVNEAQNRLRSFQGATSISSNQYFGREEEEEGGGGMSGAEGGLLGEGGLSNLEIVARDTISKVLSNPDVQNMGETIRTGALKVRNTLHSFGVMIIWLTSFFTAL